MIGRTVRLVLRRERRRLRQHRHTQQEEDNHKLPVAVNLARHDWPDSPLRHTYILIYVPLSAKVTRSSRRLPSGRDLRGLRVYRGLRPGLAGSSGCRVGRGRLWQLGHVGPKFRTISIGNRGVAVYFSGHVGPTYFLAVSFFRPLSATYPWCQRGKGPNEAYKIRRLPAGWEQEFSRRCFRTQRRQKGRSRQSRQIHS